MGVSRATFDAALRGVEPDLALPDLVLPGKGEVKGQAEFTKTPAQYVSAAYLTKLAEQGRALQTQHAPWLAKIESELGVQRQFVLAIWGRETAFGAHKSTYYVIKALATQAYLGRRKDLFRTELLYALKMLQDGVRTRETMTASWAGAMGLTQFMPSEFYTWPTTSTATAARTSGARCRTRSDRRPTSCAPRAGWRTRAWGYEVRLPKDVSCLQEGADNAKPLREWVKLGVVRAGGDFPAVALDQQAFVLTPAGAYGPAFLALENFLVIKRYNMSDLYALFVGSLGDRIAGGTAFVTPWADVQQLSAKGIEGIQEGLKGLGYKISIIDGKAGMNTRALIGAYQKANGLKVDCWPTQALLARVRAKAPAKGPPVKGADAAPGGGAPMPGRPAGRDGR